MLNSLPISAETLLLAAAGLILLLLVLVLFLALRRRNDPALQSLGRNAVSRSGRACRAFVAAFREYGFPAVQNRRRH